ncbi:4a-hydroxytetrahydrobiopterin dehydratase [Streptomyces canarius]
MSTGLEDWRVLGEGACAYFRAGSLAAGARLVQAISELPDAEAGHPDIDVRYDGVTVRLITLTDDFYGLSARDVELARSISALACAPASGGPVRRSDRPGHRRRARRAGCGAVLACAARLRRSSEQP